MMTFSVITDGYSQKLNESSLCMGAMKKNLWEDQTGLRKRCLRGGVCNDAPFVLVLSGKWEIEAKRLLEGF